MFETFLDLHSNESWVATTSANRIEVRPLDREQVYQVSPSVGYEPRWCWSCDELFYRLGSQVYSTRVSFAPDFEWETAAKVFEVEGFIDTPGWSYDVSPDGERLLVVVRPRELPRSTIHVIQNWTAVLGPET